MFSILTHSRRIYLAERVFSLTDTSDFPIYLTAGTRSVLTWGQWEENEMAPTSDNSIDQMQWDTLRLQANRFTYCLIDRTRQGIGTAIAVSLGQRFFFATAKHLINNSHDLAILAEYPRTPAESSDFAAKHCDEQLDVGLLELDSNAADRFDFAEGTRLLAEIDAEQELPTMVTGFPGQFVHSVETQIANSVDLQVHRCDALTFRSVVLPESQWPDNGVLCEPLTRGRDILVDYKPEPRVKHLPPGVSTIDVPPVDCHELDPRGMSGGGIWLANMEETSGRFRFPNVRLIGIQTGWYVENGWLKGHRIGRWLSMVHGAYPDL